MPTLSRLVYQLRTDIKIPDITEFPFRNKKRIPDSELPMLFSPYIVEAYKDNLLTNFGFKHLAIREFNDSYGLALTKGVDRLIVLSSVEDADLVRENAIYLTKKVGTTDQYTAHFFKEGRWQQKDFMANELKNDNKITISDLDLGCKEFSEIFKFEKLEKITDLCDVKVATNKPIEWRHWSAVPDEQKIQIMARCENGNTSGSVDMDLYLDDNDNSVPKEEAASYILAAKLFAKFQIMVSQQTTAWFGGAYGTAKQPQEDTAYIFDLAGLQFQNMFDLDSGAANDGRILLISKEDTQSPLPKGKYDDEFYKFFAGQNKPKFDECTANARYLKVNIGNDDRYLDTYAYSQVVKYDFTNVVTALNMKAQADGYTGGLNLKFPRYGVGAFAGNLQTDHEARLEEGVVQGIFDALQELLATKGNLGEIKRLELPYYKFNTPKLQALLLKIEALCDLYDIEFSILDKDALERSSLKYRTATGNGGDTHVVFGNEMRRGSVDAAEAENVKGKGKNMCPLVAPDMPVVPLIPNSKTAPLVGIETKWQSLTVDDYEKMSAYDRMCHCLLYGLPEVDNTNKNLATFINELISKINAELTTKKINADPSEVEKTVDKFLAKLKLSQPTLDAQIASFKSPNFDKNVEEIIIGDKIFVVPRYNSIALVKNVTELDLDRDGYKCAPPNDKTKYYLEYQSPAGMLTLETAYSLEECLRDPVRGYNLLHTLFSSSVPINVTWTEKKKIYADNVVSFFNSNAICMYSLDKDNKRVEVKPSTAQLLKLKETFIEGLINDEQNLAARSRDDQPARCRWELIHFLATDFDTNKKEKLKIFNGYKQHKDSAHYVSKTKPIAGSFVRPNQPHLELHVRGRAVSIPIVNAADFVVNKGTKLALDFPKKLAANNIYKNSINTLIDQWCSQGIRGIADVKEQKQAYINNMIELFTSGAGDIIQLKLIDAAGSKVEIQDMHIAVKEMANHFSAYLPTASDNILNKRRYFNISKNTGSCNEMVRFLQGKQPGMLSFNSYVAPEVNTQSPALRA